MVDLGGIDGGWEDADRVGFGREEELKMNGR